MNSKSTIWVFMIVGSTVGSFIPDLWGAGLFSVSSILFSALGAIAGIWLGYKVSH